MRRCIVKGVISGVVGWVDARSCFALQSDQEYVVIIIQLFLMPSG